MSRGEERFAQSPASQAYSGEFRDQFPGGESWVSVKNVWVNVWVNGRVKTLQSVGDWLVGRLASQQSPTEHLGHDKPARDKQAYGLEAPKDTPSSFLNRGQTDVYENIMRQYGMRTNDNIVILSSTTGMEPEHVRTE